MRNGWAPYFLALLLLTGLLARFVANDRPIVASYDGAVTWPVFKAAATTEQEPDWAITPPVPYRASATDLSVPAYQPPLAGPHVLGTDGLGRDTLAGLINGTRVAVLVGLGSLLVSLLVGLPLGAVAGFFGNGGLRASRGGAIALLTGLPLGLSYGFVSLLPLVGFGPRFIVMLMLVTVVAVSLSWLLFRPLRRLWPALSRPVGVPVDGGVLLILELTASIPGLVLLITLLAFVDHPPLWLLIVVIGLLSWTPVARFLRAELLRIRELPYIAAARMSGVGEMRLLIRHAMPNALGPVGVVAAFMVGGSILAEAMLSFLGIGVPVGEVTWGSMLQHSRARPDAWWLAVFPGLLLTLTVLACNSLRRRPT